MPALDVDMAEAKRVFDVNLWGTMGVIKAFGPFLAASKGRIVNISSMSAYAGVPWMSGSQRSSGE